MHEYYCWRLARLIWASSQCARCRNDFGLPLGSWSNVQTPVQYTIYSARGRTKIVKWKGPSPQQIQKMDFHWLLLLYPIYITQFDSLFEPIELIPCVLNVLSSVPHYTASFMLPSCVNVNIIAMPMRLTCDFWKMILCKRIHSRTVVSHMYSWLCECVIIKNPINCSLHWSLFGGIRTCVELKYIFHHSWISE